MVVKWWGHWGVRLTMADEMVGCLARLFGWGGGCEIVTGVSGEGMGVGGCGD